MLTASKKNPFFPLQGLPGWAGESSPAQGCCLHRGGGSPSSDDQVQRRQLGTGMGLEPTSGSLLQSPVVRKQGDQDSPQQGVCILSSSAWQPPAPGHQPEGGSSSQLTSPLCPAGKPDRCHLPGRGSRSAPQPQGQRRKPCPPPAARKPQPCSWMTERGKDSRQVEVYKQQQISNISAELQPLHREAGSLCFPLTLLLPCARRVVGPEGNGRDASKQAVRRAGIWTGGQVGTPETCWSQLQRRGVWRSLWNMPPLPVKVSGPMGVGLFLLTWREAVGSIPPHWALRCADPWLFPMLYPV